MLARQSDVTYLDLYWSNKFASSIEKTLTEVLSADVGYRALDLGKLQMYSVQELQEHLHSIDPKVIINMMQLFENERHRAMLIQKTLDGLRQD